jgi:hypothetical protein
MTRKATLKRKLARLDKAIPPPPLSAEELCAQLVALAEEGRARHEAIECVLAAPGAEDLSDEEVAARCDPSLGVTAEAVARFRNPPPPSPERQAKIDYIKDFFRRHQAAATPPEEGADEVPADSPQHTPEELVDRLREEAAVQEQMPPAPPLAQPQARPQPPQPESRTLTVEEWLHTPLPTTTVRPPSRRRPLAFHEGDRGWTRINGLPW